MATIWVFQCGLWSNLTKLNLVPEWIVSDLIASFIYQAADDWNILSDEVKNIFDILAFKTHISSVS